MVEGTSQSKVNSPLAPSIGTVPPSPSSKAAFFGGTPIPANLVGSARHSSMDPPLSSPLAVDFAAAVAWQDGDTRSPGQVPGTPYLLQFRRCGLGPGFCRLRILPSILPTGRESVRGVGVGSPSATLSALHGYRAGAHRLATGRNFVGSGLAGFAGGLPGERDSV